MIRRQTDADLFRQMKVGDELAKKWGETLIWFGVFSEVDGLSMKRGVIQRIVEIKCRDIHSEDFDTVYLSVRKYVALMRMHRITEAQPIFAVKFLDKIKYIDVRMIESVVYFRLGRTPRPGSANDQEAMLLVKIKDMEEV